MVVPFTKRWQPSIPYHSIWLLIPSSLLLISLAPATIHFLSCILVAHSFSFATHFPCTGNHSFLYPAFWLPLSGNSTSPSAISATILLSASILVASSRKFDLSRGHFASDSLIHSNPDAFLIPFLPGLHRILIIPLVPMYFPSRILENIIAFAVSFQSRCFSRSNAP